MWQKFTERARTAVYLGQEEAGHMGDNVVTTGHLLLGLMRMDGSSALKLLDRLGIAPDTVTNKVRSILQPVGTQTNADMMLSDCAKVSIDRAYDEARALDNNYIGTEHLLLGLIAEEIGAGRVLVRLGADISSARAAVREIQGKPIG